MKNNNYSKNNASKSGAQNMDLNINEIDNYINRLNSAKARCFDELMETLWQYHNLYLEDAESGISNIFASIIKEATVRYTEVLRNKKGGDNV